MQTTYGHNTLVWPCPAVLAMGWSHSVFITQSAHEYLLDTRVPALPRTSRLTSTSDFSLERVRHLVYVDDVVLFGTDQPAVAQAQSQYVAAAAGHGLPAKVSKLVAPSAAGVDCLGI